MIIISGGQVGVEGVAARAVFEANQSGISEKTFQSLKKLDRGHMRLPEHKNNCTTSKHDNSEIC